jgi:hypothetical protein
MTHEHPITPPLELVNQWDREWREQQNAPVIGWSANLLAYVAARAAQWGADTELEACCEWLHLVGDLEQQLRAARRPKPLSLKEKALLQLDTLNADLGMHGLGCDLSQIRRALESLPD